MSDVSTTVGAPALHDRIRGEFPQLARQLEAGRLVYLDNAATALKPRAVIDAMLRYYTEFTANVHRGKHRLSEEASEAYDQARERVARFINAEPDEIVFVRNTTEALNVLADGLDISADRRVVVGRSEHHSNIVPWQRHGALKMASVNREGIFEPDALQAAIDSKTKVFSVAHASNVTGALQPLKELVDVARRRGLLVVVDAAQSIVHTRIDVREMDCDFLAFSGHKIFGPTGIGVLYGKRERLEALRSPMVGGGTVLRVAEDHHTLKGLPYRFEAGTPHIAGAVGLAAALSYVEAIGFAAIEQQEREQNRVILETLSTLPGTRLLGPTEPHRRIPIASVAILSKAVSADHAAMVLSDTYAVMVRSGTHCAHPYFDDVKLPGTLRASASIYNSPADLQLFAESLRAVLARLGAA